MFNISEGAHVKSHYEVTKTDHNKGVFKTGQHTLKISTIFNDKITNREVTDRNFAELTVDKRAKRIAGFLSEAAIIGFSPLIGLGKTLKDLDWEGNSEAAGYMACVALFFGTIPVILATPFTLAGAAVFEVGRIIHYGVTHTTLEVNGRKYYVKTKDYENFKQSIEKGKGVGQHIVDEAEANIDEVMKSDTQFSNYKEGLNADLQIAFKNLHYKKIQQLILLGANPHFLLYKEEDNNGYKIGSIYAFANQAAEDDEDARELKEMLEHRAPDSAKQTNILSLELPKEIPEYEELPNDLKIALNKKDFNPFMSHPNRNSDKVYKVHTPLLFANLRKTYLPEESPIVTEGYDDKQFFSSYEVGTIKEFKNRLKESNGDNIPQEKLTRRYLPQME